ncbi:MAG: hypothetical protein ABI318_13910 [Chthoniobacteraceae bacterium]
MVMLQIGSRIYQPVLTPSGFHVSLDPVEQGLWRHVWRLDAHFVPADEDYGSGADAHWEYWRFFVNPLGSFTTRDWRELVRDTFLENEAGHRELCLASLENLINPYYTGKQEMEVLLGELRVIRRDGYLFTVEADGEVERGKDHDERVPYGDFRLRAEIPFASVTVEVPLNAGDPLAAAKAIAAREIQLTEFGRTDVLLYDPAIRRTWRPERSGKHTVTLEVPWRE